MQNKYDIIAQEIKYEEVKMFNEDGERTHTPTVYEYVKFSIDNGEGFLCWMFDDDEIESKYDLSRQQRSDLEDFVKFCRNIDEPREKVITEHGEDIYVEECSSNYILYEYKGKTYEISGDFNIDTEGYLHHWHYEDDELFEIKYLLHEDW